MRTDVNYTKIVDELESLRAENAALRDRVVVLERVRKMAQATDLHHPNDCWESRGCVCGLNRLYEALAAAEPAAQRPTPSPETLAERAPLPPADLVQASQEGEHPAIHAKGVEGMKAVRMLPGEEVT